MEALAVGAGMTAGAERGERQIGRAGMTNRIRLKIDWKEGEPVRKLGRSVKRLTRENGGGTKRARMTIWDTRAMGTKKGGACRGCRNDSPVVILVFLWVLFAFLTFASFLALFSFICNVSVCQSWSILAFPRIFARRSRRGALVRVWVRANRWTMRVSTKHGKRGSIISEGRRIRLREGDRSRGSGRFVNHRGGRALRDWSFGGFGSSGGRLSGLWTGSDRSWSMLRCSRTHNRIALTDELQVCSHGFFVQITVPGVFLPMRLISHAGVNMLAASSILASNPTQGISIYLRSRLRTVSLSWLVAWHSAGVTRLPGMTDFFSKCVLGISRSVEWRYDWLKCSIYELDAFFDLGRTYMVAVLTGPPPGAADATKVLYVRMRLDGYFEDGAIWSPGRISCPGIVEQLGLLVICTQHDECKCYHMEDALCASC